MKVKAETQGIPPEDWNGIQSWEVLKSLVGEERLAKGLLEQPTHEATKNIAKKYGIRT